MGHRYHCNQLKWPNALNDCWCLHNEASELEFSAQSRHERRTLLSLAHFFRARMMNSTWGFPGFRSRDNTSLSVSLEHKQDMWGNKIRSRTHHLSCCFYLSHPPTLTDHRSLLRHSRCYSVLLTGISLTDDVLQQQQLENIVKCVIMIKSHYCRGKTDKHTWTPCLPVWAGRRRHMPLSCPPSSWNLGPVSPVHQTLWLHSRTGPSETTGCDHEHWYATHWLPRHKLNHLFTKWAFCLKTLISRTIHVYDACLHFWLHFKNMVRKLRTTAKLKCAYVSCDHNTLL